MPEMQTLGEIFDERFISEAKIAVPLNVTQQTVARWRKANEVPTTHVATLGALLGVDLSHLASNKVPGRPKKQDGRLKGLVEVDGQMVWYD